MNRGTASTAARLRAIKIDIVESLGRSDLSIGEIAARHGVTPRYVQMLFESESTTFTEFLLDQRLACAHRMLTDFRFAERSITSVAFDAGFGDLSYFDRAFRRSYGATPSAVRADHAMAARRPPADVVAMSRFSTDAFPERERVAAWREVFGRTVVGLDIEPLNPERFHAEATVWQLPGLGVLRASSAAVNLSHSRELIVDDDLSFMAAPTSPYAASQHGRNPVLAPGDSVLMNNAEVGSMKLTSASRFTTFRVPVAPITARVGDIGAVVARPIPAANMALRLLVGYLASMLDAEAVMTAELQQLAVTHVHDLLALALGATRDGIEIAMGRGVRAARLRAAKDFVMRQLGRHDLSAATVAAHLGVAPRYVDMLFETEGESSSEFVLGQRLLRAHRMLMDPQCAGRSISAIAFDVGFGDLFHFNRTFRRRFGGTPSEVRSQAQRRGE
jgi:AraC-like DNA-binding protein